MRERRDAAADRTVELVELSPFRIRRRIVGSLSRALLCLCAFLGGLSFSTQTSPSSGDETRKEANHGANGGPKAAGEELRQEPDNRTGRPPSSRPSRRALSGSARRCDSLLNQTRRADEIYFCVAAAAAAAAEIAAATPLLPPMSFPSFCASTARRRRRCTSCDTRPRGSGTG